MVKRAELVDAATDLNKVLDLTPEIDVKQGVEGLKAQIKEAGDLLREEDKVSEETKRVIAELSNPDAELETAGAEGDAETKIETGAADAAPAAVATKPKKEKTPAKTPAKEKAPAAAKTAAKVVKEKTPAAAKPAKPVTTGTRSRYPDDAVIRLKVSENPKQKGSAAHGRFELYKDKMTVADFLKAGGSRADLSWDTGKEFISIS